MDKRTTTPNPLRGTTHSARNRRKNYLILLIAFAAFALRVYHIDAQPLRGDEAFTIVNWAQPLSYVFQTIAFIDPQPPGALLAFHGWLHLAGNSELAARYLSTLASTLAIAPLYAIGRQTTGRKTGALATFLWAIAPYQIWHAQDARNYALWGCLSLLSIWLMLKTTKKSTHIPTWIAYTLITIASISAFYLEIFQMAAQNLFILLTQSKNRRYLCTWLTVQAIIVATLLGWTILNPTLLNSGYRPTAGEVNILAVTQTFTLGESIPPALQSEGTALATLTITTLALLIVARCTAPTTKLLVLTLTLTPLALLTALTTITGQGYFRPRYIHASAGAYILTLAIAARHQIGKPLAALVVTINILGLTHYYLDPTTAKAADWRDLMTNLTPQATSDDLIILTYPDPAFTYYYDGPANHTTLPLTMNAPAEETTPLLSEVLEHHRRIWLIPIESDYWDRGETVQTWLSENSQLISWQRTTDFQIEQYASWRVTETEIENLLNAQLANLVTLVGYNISTTTPSPDTTVTLELYWQPLTQSQSNLTVFTHLLGPAQPDGSTLWAQDDHPPQDGHTSTTAWPPNTLLRDIYHIAVPPEAPPGDYYLTIGLYDPATGQRLSITSAATPPPEPDSILLTTLAVTQP